MPIGCRVRNIRDLCKFPSRQLLTFDKLVSRKYSSILYSAPVRALKQPCNIRSFLIFNFPFPRARGYYTRRKEEMPSLLNLLQSDATFARAIRVNVFLGRIKKARRKGEGKRDI